MSKLAQRFICMHKNHFNFLHGLVFQLNAPSPLLEKDVQNAFVSNLKGKIWDQHQKIDPCAKF